MGKGQEQYNPKEAYKWPIHKWQILNLTTSNKTKSIYNFKLLSDYEDL